MPSLTSKKTTKATADTKKTPMKTSSAKSHAKKDKYKKKWDWMTCPCCQNETDIRKDEQCFGCERRICYACYLEVDKHWKYCKQCFTPSTFNEVVKYEWKHLQRTDIDVAPCSRCKTQTQKDDLYQCVRCQRHVCKGEKCLQETFCLDCLREDETHECFDPSLVCSVCDRYNNSPRSIWECDGCDKLFCDRQKCCTDHYKHQLDCCK